uniref:Uncharacterized protein n=1 Tax=viral metagenome TaxID=1070528 RepID=A0A6H1ZRG0_9ZZZZ
MDNLSGIIYQRVVGVFPDVNRDVLVVLSEGLSTRIHNLFKEWLKKHGTKHQIELLGLEE